MYTMRVFYYSQHAQAQDLEETCAEHGRILEAFRAGNHAAAAAALTDHLHRVKGRVAALAPLFPQ
jgi:DNA-binding FadR family transcriptional regulator